jgi:hypothetical protein
VEKYKKKTGAKKMKLQKVGVKKNGKRVTGLL